MALQAGQLIIAIHVLPNHSRSKDNKAMEFGQLVEYNVRIIIIFKNPAGDNMGKLISDFFSFFEKALFKVKAIGQHLRPRLGHTIKTNFVTFQTVDLEICSILDFQKRAWD